jgi:CHASE3 domain sensor protein
MVTVGLPLLAIVISTALALFGNHQRARIEADVHRHFQMASSMSDVLTLMVNAETGMRGYLLTQREEFLHPYAAAAQNLPTAMLRLYVLVEAEQEPSSHLKKLRWLAQLQSLILIDLQMFDLAKQQQYVSQPNTIKMEIYSHLIYVKRLMDKIRANLSVMQAEEGRLLNERISEINTIRQRDYFAVFLVLLVAVAARLIAWYLFKVDILRRIKHLVDNARSLRRGDMLPFMPHPAS